LSTCHILTLVTQHAKLIFSTQHWHLWPVWFYHIFPHYLTTGTIFRKQVNTEHKMCCIMTNVRHKFLIYLSIYLCLTYSGLSFSLYSEAGVQLRQWFKSAGYGVSAWELTPYPGGINHCWICTPASEDGLKESPKHVRQK
jgi:hypothetical protein